MVKGFCKVPDKKKYTNDKWPNHFAEVPRIGNKVESKQGAILKVADIINYSNGYEPLIKVVLDE